MGEADVVEGEQGEEHLLGATGYVNDSEDEIERSHYGSNQSMLAFLSICLT